jgi:hypothetical protein
MKQVYVLIKHDNHPEGGGAEVLAVFASREAANARKRNWDGYREDPDNANRWLNTYTVEGPFEVQE